MFLSDNDAADSIVKVTSWAEAHPSTGQQQGCAADPLRQQSSRGNLEV